MKALIISPRFPWPPYTGDRLRATLWLSALVRNADVTLVAPPGDLHASARSLHFYPASPSLVRGFLAPFDVFARRLPLQCLLAAAYDWRAAIERARREHGPFDVTVVLLSRLHPWVYELLEGRKVLDAVDSLSRSAEQRARAAAIPMRWLWRMEQARMEKIESGAARLYDRVVVLNGDESAALGGATVVPNGVTILPEHDGPRAFDFGFWGRLPYFANSDAAAWLLDEIWPAIRALSPDATLVIGGAEAPRALRERARSRGVTVVSPIEDVAVFARDIRVALMPLRFGTGQSTKILEAAEAGCAIVGTPRALRGFPELVQFAHVEPATDGIARAGAQLLADDDERTRLAAGLRRTVASCFARTMTFDRLATIAGDGVHA